MNKQETIRNIKDVNSLTAVIINIAEKSGLSDVAIADNNVVTAIEKGAFKNKKIALVCTLSELNGKVPQILDLVNSIISNYDEIFIVTTQKKISDYFQKWIIDSSKNNKFQFWSEKDLTELIEKFLPEYWGHNDLFLKNYEDSFLVDVQQETELKKILKLDSKYEDLLNVFVEPKIFYFKVDPETQRKVRVKVNIDYFLKNDNFFISGDAGTGKSTLLKEIGKKILNKNKENQAKYLPVLIKTSNISNNTFSILIALNKILSDEFGVTDIDKIFEDYDIVLLIDSIDEFDKEIQRKIFEELDELASKHSLTFTIGTRNYENLTKDYEIIPKHINTFLSNFDQRQVKQYLDNFFKFDLAKSDKLWESLLDNHILDRIPATPLTISLVSILYEQNGYEVPATLTDVYDNFNIFLLGRLNVKNNLEFLEINVKEKILSMYALEIIKTPNRIRKNKEDFKKYLVEYFNNKSITIDDSMVPELINSITEGTGILYIDDSDLVTFKHDHFMEYYASREIFNQHKRNELEDELIKNFTEYNWQNTAIFYAGRTKDMPEFLTKLVERVNEYDKLNHCLLAISGLGYILQSLWMTDSKIRKDGVVAALELLIKADAKVKLLAESKFHFFQGIRDIDIALMNLVWFYNHFNSIALRDPLNLAFEDLHSKLDALKDTAFDIDKTTREYQLFCIASTLNTGRNEDSSKLEHLFDRNKILSNPLFAFLFDNAIRILEYSNEKKLREDFKLKNKIKKYTSTIRFYLDKPAEDLRYTTYEVLSPIKKVEIYTEGKSDAKIIDHAFRVLVNNKEPYWNITSMDNVTSKGGGANELSKHLKQLSVKIKSDIDKEKIIIGIFDNDEKGFREFNSLGENFELINGIVKKDKANNLYAILLPIPEGEVFKPYHQEKQVFKFYSIEHYFDREYLESFKMIKTTSIDGVYEIIGDKNKFSESVLENTNIKDFKNFIYLLNEIDGLCNIKSEYID